MSLSKKNRNTGKEFWKKTYLPPVISVVQVMMESGFAAGSARITPGGAMSDFQPELESWENIGGLNGAIDA